MNSIQFLLVDDKREYNEWARWTDYGPSGAQPVTFVDLEEPAQVSHVAHDPTRAIAWCTDSADRAYEVIEKHAAYIQGFFVDINLGERPLSRAIPDGGVDSSVEGLEGNVDGLRLAFLAKWRNPSAFIVGVTGYGPGSHMEKVATANSNRLDLWVEKSSRATLYFAFRRAWDNARSLLLSAPPDHAIIGLNDELSLVRRYTQGSLTEPILVLGETGTGKEVIARSVYREIKSKPANSGDRRCQYIAVNCAAIPETLIESELFGAAKGAYTGAEPRAGALEAAGTGLLLLDEVGELPPIAQAKLLRALETREIQRLGNTTPVPIAARIVAATHRNLSEMVCAGGFREDLYYRISTFSIMIPPLRERKSDIDPLVNLFLADCGTKLNRRVVMAEQARDVLTDYNWPGNVRQLQKCIWRMCVSADVLEGSIQHISKLEAQREISALKALQLPAGRSNQILDPKTAFGHWMSEKFNNRSALSKELGIDQRQLSKILRHLKFPDGVSGRKRTA